MILYDRIYYTLYRMTLKLADMFSTERETPRTEVVLILSFFTGINIITIFGLSGVFLERSVFSDKKIYVMIMLFPIVALNFLLIFYKQRYKKIEKNLLPTWESEKSKNIWITILYIIFTVIFFCLSVEYIKNHALK
jgi:SNF family Na+-dependent transporter